MHTHTHRSHKLASHSLQHHRAPPPHLCLSQTPRLWAAGVRECPGRLAWAGMALAVAGVERKSSQQMTGGTEGRKREGRNAGEQGRKKEYWEREKKEKEQAVLKESYELEVQVKKMQRWMCGWWGVNGLKNNRKWYGEPERRQDTKMQK